MIGKVQLDTATQVSAVSKASNDIVVNDNIVRQAENDAIAADVTVHNDKVEISNEAHTASQNTQARDFPETFSVNFWTRGVEE